jgi:membrane-associated phospholipid phosphatase
MKLHILTVASAFLWISSSFAQSPYSINWENERYILTTGAAAATTGLVLDRNIAPLAITDIQSLSRESVNWFDRSATYNYSTSAGTASDILFGIATAAPLLLVADESMRSDWKTIGVMYGEVWSFIGATTMIAKSTALRTRPFVYNPDAPQSEKLTPDARKSFFSGHTTVAFASAVFISSIYGEYYPKSEWKPYVWAGSLLVASTTGYLRYQAGAHFPSDIIVGAVIGSAIGYLIPLMHKTEKDHVVLSPEVRAMDYGLTIQWKW